MRYTVFWKFMCFLTHLYNINTKNVHSVLITHLFLQLTCVLYFILHKLSFLLSLSLSWPLKHLWLLLHTSEDVWLYERCICAVMGNSSIMTVSGRLLAVSVRPLVLLRLRIFVRLAVFNGDASRQNGSHVVTNWLFLGLLLSLLLHFTQLDTWKSRKLSLDFILKVRTQFCFAY